MRRRPKISEATEDRIELPLENAEGLPAAFRWVLRFPGSPLWLAGGAGLLYLAIAATLVGLVSTPLYVVNHVTYALCFAWVPWALVALVHGTGRDAVDLAPALQSEAASLRTLVFAAGSRALPISLVFALAMAGLDLVVMIREGLLLESHPGLTSFLVIREVVACVSIFGVLGWAASAAFRLSRETQERARPDLLNTRPLAPLARCGTRMLLFWVLMIALNLPLMAGGLVSGDAQRALISISVVLIALAAAALAIPTWGARQAMRGAKTRELERVRAEIRDAREARDDERLPGLLAWEARIEATPEWPIDAKSLRLSGLYVLIPVASWIGGALVERVVDSVVG